MEEFLGPVNLLLSTPGFPVLQSVARRDPDWTPTALRPELRFSRRGVEATGASRDDGFVVYAGSVGVAEVREHLGKRYVAVRDSVLKDEELRVERIRLLVTADILLTSPSAPAAILAGGAYNGREARKTESRLTAESLREP